MNNNESHAMSKKHKAAGDHGSKRELRVYAAPQRIAVRKNPDGSRSVEGYFLTWDTLSHDLGFRERVLKGAFTESLTTTPVRCLFNHDDNMLLGRTESQTLTVEEDSKGLHYRVKLPTTTYANDLAILLDRGDAYECSWGFMVPDGGDEWTNLPDGTLLRTISKAIIFEGSILVSPAAYPNTSASLRSLPKALRAKLKTTKRDDDLDDDPCDPESDSYDEDNPDCDENRSCACDCASCEAGDCDECSNDSCSDETCADNDCPAASATRSLRKRLDKAILRRLEDVREAAYQSDRAWVVNRLDQLNQSSK
jgi:HK97 family phage prohead protease